MNMARCCAVAASVLVALELVAGGVGHADTVLLKSGGVLHGKARREDDRVIVDFGAPGRIMLRAGAVLAIREDEKNDFERPEEGALVPIADRKPVVVTLKTGTDHYGAGRYIGWRIPSDDERVVLLELPGGGRMRLLAESVESVEEVTDEEEIAPAVAPGAEAISTTHLVTLRNGRKLVGNLLPGGDDEPVKLELGSLGVMVLRRADVASVEEQAGTYRLPPPAEATPPAAPVTEGVSPEQLEAIRRQLRREIIQELLEGVIEEKIERKIDDAVGQARRDLEVESLAAGLSPDRIVELEYYAQELQRQRSINRVWAERQLKRVGPVALPFISPLVDHPLWLTRRAVQRLVRDSGDVRGTPLAIEALDDEDVFVRQIAGETVRATFGPRAAYRAEASRREIQRAQARLRVAWKDIQRQLLLESVASKL